MSNELITGWALSFQFTPRSADSSVCVWNADAKELEKTLNGREPTANALNGREMEKTLNGRELEKTLTEEDDITAIDWSVGKEAATEP